MNEITKGSFLPIGNNEQPKFSDEFGKKIGKYNFKRSDGSVLETDVFVKNIKKEQTGGKGIMSFVVNKMEVLNCTIIDKANALYGPGKAILDKNEEAIDLTKGVETKQVKNAFGEIWKWFIENCQKNKFLK